MKQNKKRKYNNKKRDRSLTRLDSHVFKKLNNIMTKEHKEMLGKHLIEVGYKLVKDNGGKTIDDVIVDMKNVFIQIKKLKNHYDNQS